MLFERALELRSRTSQISAFRKVHYSNGENSVGWPEPMGVFFLSFFLFFFPRIGFPLLSDLMLAA